MILDSGYFLGATMYMTATVRWEERTI